jgi:hypothetical protein
MGEPAHLDSHRNVVDGKPEVWMVEGGTPNTLLRRGITKDTVAIGTEVIVDGYQTKDHSLKRANGRDVTFADGRKLFMGSSGTGAPSDGSDPTEVGRSRRAAEESRRQLRISLREAYPAAACGHCEPQRNRQRADQHLAARCVRTDSSARHARADREREDQRNRQRFHLQPERRAVIALDRLRQEQRYAGGDHADQRAIIYGPRLSASSDTVRLLQQEPHQPQVHEQHRPPSSARNSR